MQIVGPATAMILIVLLLVGDSLNYEIEDEDEEDGIGRILALSSRNRQFCLEFRL